jgi:hypothetical protein
VSPLLSSLHAWLRWALLLAGAAASARCLHGWARGRAWSRLDERLGLAFAVGLDVQFTLGAVLYFGFSLIGARAIAAEGVAIVHDPVGGFWAILHPLLGTGALALAHLARIRMRTVTSGPARHRLGALLFGGALGLLVLAVG